MIRIRGMDHFESSLVSLIHQYHSFLNQENKTLILSRQPIESYEWWILLLQKEILGFKSHISSLKKLESHTNTESNKTSDKASLVGIMENVMNGIAKEANHLEDTLKQESFEKNLNSSSSTVETVLKIDQESPMQNPNTISNGSLPSQPVFDKQVTHLM